MNSNLQEFLVALSEINAIEIEVVNTDKVRVFSTGVYKERIGEISDECLYEKVISEKRTILIESPKNNKECKVCFNNRCLKKIILATPLTYKEQILGAISIFSFSLSKRDEILEKITLYTDILKKISRQITDSFFIENYSELYHEIFLKMKKAVFILNENGQVIDYNRSANSYFSMFKELRGKKVIINFKEDNNYVLSIGNISLEVKAEIKSFENKRSFIIFKKSNKFVFEDNFDQLLIGKSKAILELNRKIKMVSNSKIPVMIKGEVGSDEEIIGKLIHNLSERRNKKYVSINCRDEDEEHLEEKIFGNDFNKNLKIGLLENLDGGTLFIEEIECMPIHIQKKLLYYLRTSMIIPENSEKQIISDVRIIVSTRIDLLEKVRQNKFIENLFYAIDSVKIEMPGLKYRKDDMDEIVEYLIEKHSKIQNKKIDGINEKAKKLLIESEWKGNWKELDNALKVIVELTPDDNEIGIENIPERIKELHITKDMKFRKIRKIAEVEKEEIIAALSQFGTDTDAKQIVAKKLGIGVATLYRKIEKYQIDKKSLI
ncbi:sigma 54-interacting transcriptional regulator [Cetobacterium somerae]|uniref:Sigma-54 interaction domain protein n=1 Tax=Cetobacterium somerae ATCC BAA-474 TaxID=1319815 RepID=U7V8S2_9FUSO|nr:sigma 54-interacting transcriptional regulator [Cetobacterium somerae]ERT67549.1 Sigma-54 interaction domain protein [Cetobacterium somerae ATCC BAA-474]MCQ9626814.1 sigma-54-dependent Fis family transcriptional regulator [Cetobacterium somerae]WVJ02482.1 sigma 54-interacting transcriptional regulator [Cetobacterium somerae]